MDRIEIKFATDAVDDKTGEFTGYGAAFGNIDAHGDVIARGAFKASLRDWRTRKELPPMLLQHGGFGMVDTDGIPIGKWTAMEEDEAGLRVEGRLINLDTDLGKRVYGAMREGVLKGLSIGYRAKKFVLGTKPTEPNRTLEAVDLFEVSVVTVPANDRARIAAVKSYAEMTIREMEEALQSGMLPRLSARDAKALLSGGFKALSAGRDAGDLQDIAAALRGVVETIR